MIICVQMRIPWFTMRLMLNYRNVSFRNAMQWLTCSRPPLSILKKKKNNAGAFVCLTNSFRQRQLVCMEAVYRYSRLEWHTNGMVCIERNKTLSLFCSLWTLLSVSLLSPRKKLYIHLEEIPTVHTYSVCFKYRLLETFFVSLPFYDQISWSDKHCSDNNMKCITIVDWSVDTIPTQGLR